MYISGKLECAYNSEISPDTLDDYDAVRSKLLKSLGDTPLQAARKWWSLSKQPDGTFNSFYQCLNSLNIRRLEEVHTKQDIINLVSLSLFLDSLPHSCFNFVMSRDPKTGSDAVGLATEFFQSQSRFRQCRPHSDYSSQHLGVAGQRVQPGPSRSFLDPNGPHTLFGRW